MPQMGSDRWLWIPRSFAGNFGSDILYAVDLGRVILSLSKELKHGLLTPMRPRVP